MRDRFQVSRVRPHVHWKSSLSRTVACTSVRSQIAPHVHLISVAIKSPSPIIVGTHPRIRHDLAGSLPLQPTQIVRHVAELPDHLGIAEIARSWVTRAAECDRADVTLTRSPRCPCCIAATNQLFLSGNSEFRFTSGPASS
jgi:hypothetical protein